MFGSKFRSWMEAVRPRKKQHRKDKQQSKSNQNNINASPSISANRQNSTNCQLSENNLPNNINGGTRKISPSSSEQGAPTSRYSANNLSSPESAYSTGYSTDGTSPGAPPDYYINVRTGVKYFSAEGDRYNHNQQLHYIQRLPNDEHDLFLCSKQIPSMCTSSKVSNLVVHQNGQKSALNTQTQEVDTKIVPTTQSTHTTTSVYQVTNNNMNPARLNEVIGSPILTSPRQRNRIRTNPWLPSSTLSPGQIRQDFTKTIPTTNPLDSPVSRKFQSPSSIRVRNSEIHCRSLSSSSCSSLSGTGFHWDNKRNDSGTDEDDCTLNEMMGKYDESYVYEKETDILSDSDPTDCDTDIDTGQDGGDEDEPLEGEFDFIDNSSYLEFEPKQDRNTGHCIYYNFEIQRKISRRRTARKNKQQTNNEKKRRSSSNKKRYKQLHNTIQLDGSKSAGATPLSVRRTNNYQISKLTLEDCLKKRSNSANFSRDPITTIDKRDKEADRKYKELIVEAEHILQSMKTNGLSPRRVPGPPNKRVEILRSAECAKPDLFMKNRLIDELSTQFHKIPSNNFNCPRFSPKKNHITNFINNNSPVILKRDNELSKSPLVIIKKTDDNNLQLNRNLKQNETNRPSPKYRKKINKIKLQQEYCTSTSSESEKEERNKNKYYKSNNYLNIDCPQSEPVRRKVYSGHTKTVAFNLNCENKIKKNSSSPSYSPIHHRIENIKENKLSAENLRQQVLLNTITNLKRSLEDQSASLKQVYKSSQNINI